MNASQSWVGDDCIGKYPTLIRSIRRPIAILDAYQVRWFIGNLAD